jgi:hypothetical protein
MSPYVLATVTSYSKPVPLSLSETGKDTPLRQMLPLPSEKSAFFSGIRPLSANCIGGRRGVVRLRPSPEIDNQKNQTTDHR